MPAQPAQCAESDGQAAAGGFRLPAWIVDSPAWAAMKTPIRWTLIAIAGQCDRRLEDGSLFGAFGGPLLYDAVGVSRRTFWRHARLLERLGFLVPLRFRSTDDPSDGTHYGIPATAGALEPCRTRRRHRRMVRDQLGAYRPVDTRPGDQSELWPDTSASTDPSQVRSIDPARSAEEGVCHDDTGGCVKLTQGVCQTDTPNHGYGLVKNHGSGRGVSARRVGSGDGSNARPSIRAVRIEDLGEDGRLELLWADALRHRLVSDCEADRLRFWSMAEHVLQLGASASNPGGLFAANIRGKRWLFISQLEEDAARRRLSRTGDGLTNALARDHQAPGGPRSPAAEGLDDVEILRRLGAAAAKQGLSGDLCGYIARWIPGWTEERHAQAAARLEEGR